MWCCIDRGRNTSDLAREVSCGCTAVCLELDLQTTLYHPVVLLGSVPWCKLYHYPMQHYQNLWRAALCFVWVCGNRAGYDALVMKDLHSCRLDYYHQCWSVGSYRTLIIRTGEH